MLKGWSIEVASNFLAVRTERACSTRDTRTPSFSKYAAIITGSIEDITCTSVSGRCRSKIVSNFSGIMAREIKGDAVGFNFDLRGGSGVLTSLSKSLSKGNVAARSFSILLCPSEFLMVRFKLSKFVMAF